ncbi:MAG: hypothetical protein ACVCEJ_09030 [Candidatus Izemoplasmataceae bacterium]
MDQVFVIIQDNLLISIIIGLIIVFIIYRIFKNLHFYMSSARYAKKAKRLRKKKYNGILLVEKIRKRRKKNTNNFKKLKRKGKKLTKKYLDYKAEELPIIAKYADSKMLKSSRRQLLIVVYEDRKTKKKYKLKHGSKQFINIIDTYDCLDEFIEFLHKLPDTMINDEDLDFFVEKHGVTIGYVLK